MASQMDTDIAQPPLAHHDSRFLDLAFAMDTTGSMGSYIDTARRSIRHIVEEIVAKESSDVRLALVEYRDHPPQDRSYVTQVHDFTARVGDMKQWLDASSADGGGDAPEAVADALHDVLKLSWRAESTKICVLVSDAPPHGLQPGGDSFPNGCPAGHDPMAICRQLAEKGVTLYVAGCEPALRPYKEFFAALAYITGGQYVPLAAASTLTQVIIGGAQEELSLQQWMDQVNEHVMQQVQERGAENLDMASLSSGVMKKLGDSKAKSKQLRQGGINLVGASSYAKNTSACVDMAAVRSEWSKGGRPVDECSYEVPADTLCSVFPPSGPPMARRSAPTAFSAAAPRGGGPPLPMAFGAPSAPANCGYEAVEDDIHVDQAERMVQRALQRNQINLASKK